MKIKIVIIYILSIMLLSCAGEKIKKPEEKTGYLTRQADAVFKNAELVFGDEWKIIFRRLDDYQYLVFNNNIEELNSFSYSFITQNSTAGFHVNTDYMNIKFRIDYIETSIPDPSTGENLQINRIISITRIPGDRYAAAGLDSDIDADDFIMNVKEMARTEDADSLSQIIAYPLYVYINKKRTRVTGPEMFISNFEKIFNKKVMGALSSQILSDVKADKNGLLIGKGIIRIKPVNGQFIITEINNR